MKHLYAHWLAITMHKFAWGISLPSAGVITIWYLRQYPLLFYNRTLPAHSHSPFLFFSSYSLHSAATCIFLCPFSLYLLQHFCSLLPHRHVYICFSFIFIPSPTQIHLILMACEFAHNKTPRGKGIGMKRAVEGREEEKKKLGLISILTHADGGETSGIAPFYLSLSLPILSLLLVAPLPSVC